MKVSTASQITYIKHNSLIQYADLFKKRSSEESDTSSDESDDIEFYETEIDDPIEGNELLNEFFDYPLGVNY